MRMNTLRYGLIGFVIAAVGAAFSTSTLAAEYEIDPTHSFVSFKIKHLGYSWMIGMFNDISGEFTYDADNPSASKITVNVDMASVDTNHAERDKHLRSDDFLDVGKNAKASFKSTKYTGDADGGTIEGELTVGDVTQPVAFEVKKIGEGKDPWGGYRAGFEGSYVMTRKDFGVEYNLGPTSEEMELGLFIEGIRK